VELLPSRTKGVEPEEGKLEGSYKVRERIQKVSRTETAKMSNPFERYANWEEVKRMRKN
jgi:hypothetical protein